MQWDLSMNDVPEFRGNAKAIRTDLLVDTVGEHVYLARQTDREEWERTGGEHGHQYLSSAIWFNRIGRAMGEPCWSC